MSEIDIHHQRPADVAAPDAISDSALVQWARAADEAFRIAEKLSRTSFVPQSLRGKPDDITAAILAGSELGMQPMAALRSMDVIQGAPALRAHAMRGLVQSKGHSVQLVESDDQHCVMRGRRRGEAEWQEVTWTLARAERLGVTERNPQWKKQPQSMLVARATGEICRLIASDVLHAMPYASEELDGSGAADGSAQVPRVTVRELVDEEFRESAKSEPTLSPDDPWYVPAGEADEAADAEVVDWPTPAEPGGAR